MKPHQDVKSSVSVSCRPREFISAAAAQQEISLFIWCRNFETNNVQLAFAMLVNDDVGMPPCRGGNVYGRPCRMKWRGSTRWSFGFVETLLDAVELDPDSERRLISFSLFVARGALYHFLCYLCCDVIELPFPP